jgi:hypothetical protein
LSSTHKFFLEGIKKLTTILKAGNFLDVKRVGKQLAAWPLCGGQGKPEWVITLPS